MTSLLTLALFFPLGFPDGSDLAKVDRGLRKEPTYRSKPSYALLVFGEKAGHRAWLVVDGDAAYVDRNGNGDLTESDETVSLNKEETVKVKTAPGGRIKGMNIFDLGQVHGVKLQLRFWVRDENHAGKDEHELLREANRLRREHDWENASLYRIANEKHWSQNPLVMTRSRQDAQVCHLSGPLTIAPKWAERQKFVRGDPQCMLDVNIGTPGRPPAHCPYTFFAPLATDEVPADLHPVARIDFSNKEAGGAPITVEVVLADRC
jgi:hypothetical protein